MATLANLLRNSLRAGWGEVMLNKLALRWKERATRVERPEVERWCRAQTSDPESWALALDAKIWNEAKRFARDQKAVASERLNQLGLDLGGGGAYDLLYFLVRVLRPDTVVETGVAAGFSSRAMLSALRENGHGKLYSSDFPYFRLPDPEKFVGYIVEPDLRDRWELHTRGDQVNLQEISLKIERVDLFHYDSDKSVAGRNSALVTMNPLFHDTTLIIYDDIQDNGHFRRLVEQSGQPYLVFEFEGKWLGLTGGPTWLFEQSAGAERAQAGSAL